MNNLSDIKYIYLDNKINRLYIYLFQMTLYQELFIPFIIFFILFSLNRKFKSKYNHIFEKSIGLILVTWYTFIDIKYGITFGMIYMIYLMRLTDFEISEGFENKNNDDEFIDTPKNTSIIVEDDKKELDFLLKNKDVNNKIFLKNIFHKKYTQNFVLNMKNYMYKLNSSSSSIIQYPYSDEKYIMIVRNNNYYLDVNGNSIISYDSNNKKIVTVNKIMILDNFYNIEKEYLLDTIYKNTPYIGLEDVRFFNFNEKIYYIGSYYNENTKNIEIASNIYNINDSKLSPIGITPSFLTKNKWEKNWVFFNNNNELNVIYQWNPLYICKINYKTKKLELVKENRDVPVFFKKFRGSTNGVLYEEKTWFIVHFSVNNSGKQSYKHVFVVFDKDMNLFGYSEPFKFENYMVEFCIGMTLNKKTNNFIITYSTLDKTTNLMVLPNDYVKSIIIVVN